MGGGDSRGDVGIAWWPAWSDRALILPTATTIAQTTIHLGVWLGHAADDHDEGYRLKALGSPRRVVLFFGYMI